MTIALNEANTEVIRATLDELIYGDSTKKTNWSEMITDALLNKKPHRLSDFVSSGKGFNDSTKKAFCTLLNKKPTYSQKGIDRLIADHCEISIDKMLLERELIGLKQINKYALSTLIEEFSNGTELADSIVDMINKGFNTILTQGKKSYLANAEGSGYWLKRTIIKKYAVSLIKVATAEKQLSIA
jgi:hypothetical protein